MIYGSGLATQADSTKRRGSTQRRTAWALAWAALLLTGGCQALVDTNTVQCRTDVDCKALNPLSRCTEELTCTLRCEAHSDCQSLSETAACIDTVCVELLTEECTELQPPDILTHEKSILLGFITSDDSYGRPLGEAAELALWEIEETGKGLPGQRHLGMVMCAHQEDKEALAATTHLIDKVRVPAIVGGSYSGVTGSIAQVANPKDVLVVSPSATSPALSGSGEMLRRTAPSDLLQGELLKWLVMDVTKALRAQGVLGESEDPSVVVLAKPDSAGQGLLRAVTGTDAQRVNAAPGLSSNLAPRNTADLSETAPEDVDWDAYVQFVLSRKPHIILALGTGEFARYILPEIEAQWQGDVRPWYVLPEGNRVDDLRQVAASNPEWDLGQRVIGSAPGARQSNAYGFFAASFEAHLSPLKPGNMAEFAYDTVYWIAYSILLSGQTQPTGPELASAMNRVTCKGEGRVASAPSSLEFRQVADSLTPDTCFDLEGASGPLDFDPETGDAESDLAMWCLRDAREANEVSFEPLLKDYYSVSEGKIVREEQPPIDFATEGWCKSVAEAGGGVRNDDVPDAAAPGPSGDGGSTDEVPAEELPIE